MGGEAPIIIWFRRDLRLGDNPALNRALQTSRPIVPVYLLEDGIPMGEAGRWWLYKSLVAFNESLGLNVRFYKGDALSVLPEIIADYSVDSVFWNKGYEPSEARKDGFVKKMLEERGVRAECVDDALLFSPEKTLKEDGTPYRVFTPFYQRGCLKNHPRKPYPPPRSINFCKKMPHSDKAYSLDNTGLDSRESWHRKLGRHWTPGEAGALTRLEAFLISGVKNYKKQRDEPGLENGTSRLSPHLHFGEISPHQIWYAVKRVMAEENCDEGGEAFLRQLAWREFSSSLLHYFPDLPTRPLQKKFDSFPWRDDKEALCSWQNGQTGYPLVDAGMRELWQTGYMHNRLRMITGSFLVKNLLIHWHHGEQWFRDKLVDADWANNSAGWQWIAGCGADAAPYFRIFNPVTQAKRFDASGDYIRRYVPEIAALPDRYLASPGEGPADILKEAGIILGRDYPHPVVGLKESRARALEAFSKAGEAISA